MSGASSDEKHIYVSIFIQGEGFVPAGTVVFNDVANYAGFVYYNSYIQHGYPPLNPGTLNYQTHKTPYFPVDTKTNPDMVDRTFWELLPTQGDFGTNVLISHHPEYFSMNNAQKLYFLGSRVVGGLSCYVDKPQNEQNIVGQDWLDEIRRESVAFFTRRISSIQHVTAIDALTSYGGVRPKAMYKDEHGHFWIAKFNLPSDPYNMARAEHLAMTMSRDAGLVVPDSKVLTLASGEDVFLTKRFDRHNDSRHHGLSFFSVAPSIEFERTKPKPGQGHTAAVMGTLVSRFSQSKQHDQEALARKLLVDVGFNNTDNHLRNIRFILDGQNKWVLSPSFDILFDPTAKPHTYSPTGLSREDTHLNNENTIKQIASYADLPFERVLALSERVDKTLANFETYASAAQLNEQDFLKIQTAVNIGKIGPVATFKLEEQKRLRLNQAATFRPTSPALKPK
jgi:HipA-like C-terminal domain